jgi:hypothetical protein
MVGRDAAATTVDALVAPPDQVEAALPAVVSTTTTRTWSVPV